VDDLRPKAVLFDLGSTLIEYEAVSWDELSRLCALEAREWLVDEGYAVPEEEEFHVSFERAKAPLRQRAWETLTEWTVPEAARALCAQLEIPYSDELAARFFEEFYRPVDRLLYAYDDAVATLERIRAAVPAVGLISNTVFPEDVHLRELRRFGLSRFFDFTIFSSTFGKRKPHPDIFVQAANQAGYGPAECVYIGDRYVEDIEGPHGVGMPAILKMKAGREYPAEMPLARRRIGALAELADHLRF